MAQNDLASMNPKYHGTTTGYHNYGCRCELCKTARREESTRRRRADPGAKRRERQRQVYDAHYAADFAAMWQQQAGLCYLCNRALGSGREVHMDHDHSCCPQGKSCKFCRRGLACMACNTMIGLVREDPALLRLIADNLELVSGTTRERIKRHQQPDLGFPPPDEFLLEIELRNSPNQRRIRRRPYERA